MSWGVRVKNASGRVSVDFSSNLARDLRDIYTGVSDGAVLIPEWASGRGWFVVLETLPLSAPTPASTSPNVWKSGSTLYWAWPSFWNWSKTPATIRVGVY